MQFARRWALVIAVLGLALSPATGFGQGAVGEVAPDFTLVDLDGNEVSLSDYRGKVVALTFWGWGCIECREVEMPALQARVHDLYSRDQIQVLSLNQDPQPDMEQLIAYREEKGLEYPILINALETAFDYRVFATPILFLIDKDGVIRHKEANKVFDDETAVVVEELVAELEVGNQVGKRALGFTLENLDIEPVSLSDYAGKTIVLGFFGSKDGNCGDVLDPLQQALEAYGDDVVVLGVTMDLEPDPEVLKTFKQERNVDFTLLMDGLKTAVHYGFFSAGAVIIDSEGVIQYRQNVPLTTSFFDTLDALIDNND
jgi:peroxiredoxin